MPAFSLAARWKRSARVSSAREFVVLEIAVCSEASSMNDPFRDAFVIEMKNLFAKMKILHRGRSASPYFQRILIVGNRRSLLSRQRRTVTSGDLVSFAAFSAPHLLVVQLRGFMLASN